ncbi:peptide/nickel transport system ATP-binding protein [Lachnotalea glycerini]|uniref:Peptide/nickel transport system ATP-binding protein n=2 Tax=Lachnotalea glycerini TaxID=1763509 RepID=A0A318EJX4_9FIRM|nr:peptide/nickel transport system ATP-binding protein [Lachnotalea glycerini]
MLLEESCMNDKEVLKIENLFVHFGTGSKKEAVNGVSLTVQKGKITALIGESGCGKTTVALAVMGLLGKQDEVKWSKLEICQNMIQNISFRKWQFIRGNKVSMIFQDPLDSLDPLFTVGNQIIEGIRSHQKVSKKQAYNLAVKQLKNLQFEDAERIMKCYPFELSGGMCQRVMIAIAILARPGLLIADEPTTALDVTVQAEILKQIYQMSRNYNMGVLFITHDLGVVAEIADNVYIMHNGKIIEDGNVEKIFNHPVQNYTKALLESIL